MKAVTIKISDSMNAKLRQHAAARKEGMSETIRRALARELGESQDFARLAAPYRGMFRGPARLSSAEGYSTQS